MKTDDFSLMYKGSTYDPVVDKTITRLSDVLKNPRKSASEKLEYTHKLSSELKLYNRNDYNHIKDCLIYDAALAIKASAAYISLNSADTDLEGCVWTLFDLIAAHTKVGEGIRGSNFTIDDVIENYLNKFFDDVSMFWEAYKTLVLIDVIEPGYILALTPTGMIVGNPAYLPFLDKTNERS